MSNDDVKKTLSKPMVVGLVTLILGVLIGVAAEKYAGRSPVLAHSSQATTAASGSPTVETTNRQALDALIPDVIDPWDPFREMRNLQAEMDEMFRNSITRFHMNPQMDIFKDDAGYSLSLDVRELKDRFEVRAFLPDAKAPDAKVKLTGNLLEVEVTHQQMEKKPGGNGSATATEWGRYTQMVELAGNLKSDQMKVERKDHELLITIPKA